MDRQDADHAEHDQNGGHFCGTRPPPDGQDYFEGDDFEDNGPVQIRSRFAHLQPTKNMCSLLHEEPGLEQIG